MSCGEKRSSLLYDKEDWVSTNPEKGLNQKRISKIGHSRRGKNLSSIRLSEKETAVHKVPSTKTLPTGSTTSQRREELSPDHYEEPGRPGKEALQEVGGQKTESSSVPTTATSKGGERSNQDQGKSTGAGVLKRETTVKSDMEKEKKSGHKSGFLLGFRKCSGIGRLLRRGQGG